MPAQTPASNLKPEIILLLCCARRTLDAGHSAQLARTLEMQIDWPLLIRLADENGLFPLLYYHLAQFSGMIPAEWRMKLQEVNRLNTLRALFLTSELQRITKIFHQRAIPVLPYKGPVLAELAYGDALLRQFDDLDIVVPQQFMAAIYEEMALLGYQPRFSRERFLGGGGKNIPGEYVFVHSLNRAIVEFHTEATLRHFPRPPDLEAMSGRAVGILLNGRQIPTFSMADMLLMLCVHGAKDFWSRLIWVADIAAVSTMLTPGDWDLLATQAKKYDARRMVSLGLWLAHCLLEAGISNANNADGDYITPKIGAALRDQLLGRKPAPNSLWWRSLYRIRMVQPSWKGVRYWLRLSTTPAEDDWSTHDDRLRHRAAYALLRPLRLWQKYAREARAGDESSEES